MHIWAEISVLLCLVAVNASAVPPKAKLPPSLPKVDADLLPPGHFIGTLVRTPDRDRMFTLKITYPEVRLKSGARMPNLSHAHSQYLNNQYRQMINLQRQMGRMQHHHVHNMIQMQQMYMQMQMNQQRVLARLQQQQLQEELRLLQQEIKALQSMYQVVPVTREVEFQAEANLKVRIKDPPQQFDEKGNFKKYTPQELSALKGKDKNLIGYESSLEALQPGQVVLVALHTHRKSASPALSTSASKKDKNDDKEANSTIEHKMQVSLLVILKEGDASHSLRR